MKRCFRLLFFICVALAACDYNGNSRRSIASEHQTAKQDVVSDSLIYDFTNHLFNSELKEEQCNYIVDSEYEYWKLIYGESRSLDSILFYSDGPTFSLHDYFSNADIKYMHHQWRDWKSFTWSSGLIKEQQILSVAALAKIIRNRNLSETHWRTFNTTGYYAISKPLFSIDHNRVLVLVESLCRKSRGSWGKVFVYQYVPPSKGWFRVGSGWHWVS